MSKRTGICGALALVGVLIAAEGVAQSPDIVEISDSTVSVHGVVTSFDVELRVATIGDTVVYLGDVIAPHIALVPGDELSLVGSQIGADGLVWALAIDVARLPSTQSITGTGRQSITGTGKQSITGTGRQSITGTGRQSITGTGTQSITGTGLQRQSITGTGRQSITGTGKQSITGTGTQSITGTGLQRQSITGTGRQSITGTGKQSITGTGLQRQSITGTGSR